MYFVGRIHHLAQLALRGRMYGHTCPFPAICMPSPCHLCICTPVYMQPPKACLARLQISCNSVQANSALGACDAHMQSHGRHRIKGAPSTTGGYQTCLKKRDIGMHLHVALLHTYSHHAAPCTLPHMLSPTYPHSVTRTPSHTPTRCPICSHTYALTLPPEPHRDRTHAAPYAHTQAHTHMPALCYDNTITPARTLPHLLTPFDKQHVFCRLHPRLQISDLD